MFLGHLDVAPPGRPPHWVVAHSGAVAVLHTSPHPVHNTWHRKKRFDLIKISSDPPEKMASHERTTVVPTITMRARLQGVWRRDRIIIS